MGYASGAPAYEVELPAPYALDFLANEAVKFASQADLVIFVGGLNKNTFQDSEGEDRKSYALPFGQNELIERLLQVNKRMVLVMLCGNAYETPWIQQVPALVQAWFGGSEGG